MFKLKKQKVSGTSSSFRWFMGIISLSFVPIALSFLATPEPAVSQEKQNDKVTALLRLGKVIPPITLVDTKGAKWNLHDQKDAKATVITFLDFKCPISNRYVAVLNSLHEKYKSKGVIVTAVICDSESAEELDKHTKEFLANFKVFYDPNHLVSNHFLADVTPECFLLDQDKAKVFRCHK